MRGPLIAVLLATACASSDVGLDAPPAPPDADQPDAFVPPDAMLPDAPPLGPGVFLHDAPGDFTGSTGTTTVVSAWGGVEPIAYHTGGLLARASDTGVFTSGPAAQWTDVQAMTATGVDSVVGALDRTWVAAVPGGLGLTAGDDYTITFEGEILLDVAGTWQFHLLVDDHGFLEVAPPDGSAFVRVTSADWAAEGTGGINVTTPGWHPIRIAICEQTGNAEWHLQATPPAQARGAISRHRLRFRADAVDGLVQTAFDDSYLLGANDSTIDDDSPGSADWGVGMPAGLGLSDAEHFSVRWAGQVRIDAGGDYAFRMVSDDGQRLWIDGVPRLTAWDETVHDNTTAAIALDAGWHDVVIDQMEIGGSAGAVLTIASGPQGAGAALPVAWTRPVVTRRERHEASVNRSDLAIADLGTTNAPVGIDAPAGAKVQGVEVSFGFTHTYHNDLIVYLIAPDASSVVLRDYNESPTASGARTERLFVSGLDDVNAAGTWTLRVQDQVSADSGTLLDVQLTVHHDGGQPPIPATAAYESPVIDLGLGVSGWEALTWGARAVAGSSIQLRARAADSEDAVALANWSTPMVDPGGTAPPIAPARWFQYRIEFTSDGDAAPSVDWVRLDYTTDDPQ